MSAREFKVYSTPMSILMTFGMPAMLAIAGVAVLLLALLGRLDQGSGWQLVVIIPFSLGAVASIVPPLLRPREIRLHDGGEIEFIGLLRRTRVAALEVESVKTSGGQLGFLVLKHSGGRVTLLNQFTGFHEFLVELKTLNPAVELRGC